MLYFSKLKIISVLIFTIILSYFSISNFTKFDDNFFSRNINLGLDLQGGSYLLLEIDNTPVIEQQLQNKLIQIKNFLKDKNILYKNFNIINNKIISFEVDNEFIDSAVSLFEGKNSEINPYYDQFKTNQFELLINNNNIQLSYSKYGLVQLKSSSQNQAIEIVRRRVDEIGTNEPNILKRGNDRILVELPGLDNPDRIKTLLGKTANLTFRFVTQNEEESFGTEKISFQDGTDFAIISKRIILSGDNLVDAQPRMDNQSNQTVVSFTLDRVGAKKFAKATSSGVGKRLAIILDGKIISAPNIVEPIIGGSGQITGDFTFQTATDLALLLRSGALPAPMKIIEERTVGPDLGQDSINAGILSLIIGFVLVVLFMLGKYKIFGLIANITLISNLLLLIGVLTLFEATLTLPGIAGIILTVGMAVDANVLIYERIKEEIRNENNKILAFDSGYLKSRSTILDANITTLIAAAILFVLGSGPVKGFALTLGVGILTTLFSVYFIARLMTALYVIKNKDKEKLI
ncbi:MAG TPA: protein translocase subunit SecD [Candidatus Pelagibacter bacterium]|nr:protein translocase subunit SecD [Candidatus Pelagibacter bacterium]